MSQLPLEITNFFLAMQAGPPGLEILRNLFAPDAEYTEPFSGAPQPHRGPDAIIAAFAASRSDAFDDAVITLGAVELSGNVIEVDWTCISQAIPGGRGSGKNRFTLHNGLIQSLVTTLDMPEG